MSTELTRPIGCLFRIEAVPWAELIRTLEKRGFPRAAFGGRPRWVEDRPPTPLDHDLHRRHLPASSFESEGRRVPPPGGCDVQ